MAFGIVTVLIWDVTTFCFGIVTFWFKFGIFQLNTNVAPVFTQSYLYQITAPQQLTRLLCLRRARYVKMVKTKQTAKKSTGYPAPRMALLQSQTRFMRSRRVAQATKGKGRMVSNRERHSITNNITLRMQTDVPSHVLTVEVRGPINLKADMDKDHDEVRNQFFNHFTMTNP